MTIKKLPFNESNINPRHRKALENRGMSLSYDIYEMIGSDPNCVATIRVSTYSASGQLACVLWVYTDSGTLSGSASTTGYGYSKRESVITRALASCGLDYCFESKGLTFKSLEELGRRVACIGTGFAPISDAGMNKKIFISQSNL